MQDAGRRPRNIPCLVLCPPLLSLSAIGDAVSGSGCVFNGTRRSTSVADGEVGQYDSDHVDIAGGTEAGAVIRGAIQRPNIILYRTAARSQSAVEVLQDSRNRYIWSVLVLRRVMAEKKKFELQNRAELSPTTLATDGICTYRRITDTSFIVLLCTYLPE
jgi:hypothetical protein